MSLYRSFRIVAVVAAGAVLLAALGCGGGSGGAKGRMATVEFTIRWPDASSRVIPAGTDRFVVFVSGDGIETQAYIVDQPGATNQTYRYRINVPAGTKRLFSAVAKDTSTGTTPASTRKYSNLTQVPLNSPDLAEGQTVGAGIDPNPYDIVEGSTTVATITMQEPAQPGGGVSGISGLVNQVLTPAFPSVALLQMVRDQDGNPITDLNIANIQVLEDGVPAVVTDVRTVSQAGQPISIAMVLDRSGSMGYQGNLDLETAASTFVSLMAPDDAAEVINFSSYVSVDQPFTTDKTLLLAAIQGKSAGGSTALWDAALQGVQDTAAQGGRMAVLVMTDGYDNRSSHTQADVINAAKAAGIPVFTIGLGSSVDPGLQQLAIQTGGLHFDAPTSAELQQVYQRVSGQLAGQLQISFISPDPNKRTPPKTRQLEIRIQYGQFQQILTSSYSM